MSRLSQVVRTALFVFQSCLGVMVMLASLTMIAIIPWRAPDWAPTARVLYLAAFVSLGVSGFAELRMAQKAWRFHQTDTEDVRRDTDFALGGYRAASSWRRVRNRASSVFLGLVVFLAIFFGR